MAVRQGTGREPNGSTGGEARWIAQLHMLHALATRLSRLTDIREIGEAITTELLPLVDYHNCRVYVLDADGETLFPIAFQGQDLEYAEETLEELLIKVGEGFTGHIAESRESYMTLDALHDPYAEQIEDTTEIDESLLGVPFLYGEELIGVIILSKLGTNQFDDHDVRVLEVLAPHVAVAMVNARLLQQATDSARTSRALLGLSQTLTTVDVVEGVLAAAVAAIPSMMTCSGVRAYLREPTTGGFYLVVEDPPSARRGTPAAVIPASVAESFSPAEGEAFVLSPEDLQAVPAEFRVVADRQILIAPVGWEPGGNGALVIFAPDAESGFADRDVAMARGIADIISLALGNAARFEELEESRDRLRALDEMKTTFLEAVSHDLRTPLASVLGISLTLSREENSLPPEDRTDLLDRLTANARKLERLLVDLLDLDRLMRGIVEPNRRPTDIAALLADVAEAEETLNGRKVVLACEPITVSVDGAKVERMVENLLVNAVRHTPADSTIWVRAHAQGDGVVIAVEDEGPGVPDDMKEAIFEPFRQGPERSRHAPGVGIGLSLVLRFAELHGGRAWVEDRPGGGSSFRVFLPGGPEAP